MVGNLGAKIENHDEVQDLQYEAKDFGQISLQKVNKKSFFSVMPKN